MNIKSNLTRLSWRITTEWRRKSALLHISTTILITQTLVILVFVGLYFKTMPLLDDQVQLISHDSINMADDAVSTKNALLINDDNDIRQHVVQLSPKSFDNTKSYHSSKKENNFNHKLSNADNKELFYKFSKYNISNPSRYFLKDDLNIYFKSVVNNGIECFIDGTDFEKSTSETCQCVKGYFGKDCGIPESVWYGKYKYIYPDNRLQRRSKPRRVIHGFPVHHEFAMFEARLGELYDVVDVIILAESNYSSHRDPKKLEFYNKLKNGYMSNYQEKILYLRLGFAYKYGNDSGWMSDQFIRYYLGKKGLSLIDNVKDDDLFLLTDADEIPVKEAILFLKLYDGYPEPISFAYRWNVFGFYWKYPADDNFINWMYGAKEKLSNVYSVATIKMLKHVFNGNVFFIRKENGWTFKLFQTAVNKYIKQGGLIDNWTIGNVGHYGGWHCSWCFKPEDVIKKMDAAQADDKPRWGDYPRKKNIPYIRSAIANGRWFDNKLKFLLCDKSEIMYAPKYFLQHPHEFSYLLSNPINR